MSDERPEPYRAGQREAFNRIPVPRASDATG
jgi:hypothetical protein